MSAYPPLPFLHVSPAVHSPEVFSGHVVFMEYRESMLDADLPCPDHRLVEMGHYDPMSDTTYCTGFIYCQCCWALGDLPDGACTGEHL